jgi:hypothetical protein
VEKNPLPHPTGKEKHGKHPTKPEKQTDMWQPINRHNHTKNKNKKSDQMLKKKKKERRFRFVVFMG